MGAVMLTIAVLAITVGFDSAVGFEFSINAVLSRYCPERTTCCSPWQKHHHHENAGNAGASSSFHRKLPFVALRSTQDSIREVEEASPPHRITIDAIIPEGYPHQTYGVPVGAVVLPAPSICEFSEACQTAFPDIKELRFRGTEPYDGPLYHRTNGNDTMVLDSTDPQTPKSTSIPQTPVVVYKAIHVRTEVAAALVDGAVPSLIEFIHNSGGFYLPGVRKKRRTRTMESPSTPSPLPPTPPKFTFVELFAGIGGFRLGLEPLGGHCVLACEKDPVARVYYQRHFGSVVIDANGSHKNRVCPELVDGDILDVTTADFPAQGFDLLVAGFPCQPFSDRGAKPGLEDHRGQLYQELVRILVEQQPPFFLFENVVGLVTMHGGRYVRLGRGKYRYEAGRTLDTIVRALADCGYKVQWHVVNGKHFGPQHRERVYFIGSRLDLNYPGVVWENICPPVTAEPEDEPCETRPLIRDFLEPPDSPAVNACELSAVQWEAVKRRRLGGAITEETLAGIGLDLDAISAPTLIASYKNPASVSVKFVTAEADGTLRHGRPLRPRFLTPVEFRRIMGFPDDFETSTPAFRRTKQPKINHDNPPEDTTGVDGHIYQVLGNAVIPSVIEAIGKEILRLRNEAEQTKRVR